MAFGRNSMNKLYERTEDNVSLLSLNIGKTNSQVVKYKSNWCYLKKINKPKLEITRSLLLQVKKVIQKIDTHFKKGIIYLFIKILDKRLTT